MIGSIKDLASFFYGFNKKKIKLNYLFEPKVPFAKFLKIVFTKKFGLDLQKVQFSF